MRASLPAIVAMVVALVAAHAHGQSAAPPPGCAGLSGAPLPTRAVYANGNVQTVERNGPNLRSEFTLPNGHKSIVVTYGGLFTLSLEAPIGSIAVKYRWQQDLTHFLPLRPGEKIAAEAALTDGADRSAGSFAVEMTVVGTELYRVGACDYPVFKIDVHNRFTGGDGYPSDGVRYYHAASMLGLKSLFTAPATATAPAKVVEQHVVKLE